MNNIIRSLRPKQWIKNIFVFPAIVFAGKFTDLRADFFVLIVFFLFSFTASAIYLLNDVFDIEADRNHPIKKFRPIASGKVSIKLALFLSGLLGTTSLLIAFFISPYLSLVLSLYVFNNLFYTLYFKHVVIVDIIMVALGFVFRAVGGAVAIDLSLSPWFLTITFLLTLYLSVMKRRQEFVEIVKNGGKKRKVLENYSVELLDQMGNILIPSILVSYTFFTFNTFHTQYFIVTIPLVVYGLFRYLYLVHQKDMGENPTDTLLRDRSLAFTVLLYGLVSICLIHFFK